MKSGVNPKLKEWLNLDQESAVTKIKALIETKNVTLDDVLYVVPEGPNKGKSLLWFLALDCGKNEDQFLWVLEKFKKEIPLSIFTTRADIGSSFMGPWSVLDLVFQALMQKSPMPKLAQAVWKDYKEKITLDDLLNEIPKGNFEGKSPFSWVRYNRTKEGIEILKEILQEKPGKIPKHYLEDSGGEASSEVMSLLEDRLKIQKSTSMKTKF